ncbi:HYD1 [Fusarium mexicanum]|uniref:HYD1 n=1 Tax=Fusarium mexicanum TaxID=751941 RepID=A0A8H5IGR1_9HYPO|nr:HYD1 [Fusarium mexicanum]
MENTKTHILSDGRTLAYGVYGAGGDNPAQNIPTVLHFHGVPGSHHEAAAFHASAVLHGIRIVAISRPGSSLSTPQPNRTLLDFPADVVALAEHLNIQRFAVLGFSAGGPSLLHAGTASLERVSSAHRWSLARWAPGLLAWIFDWKLGFLARDDQHPERLEQQWEADLASNHGPDYSAWKGDVELRSALVKSLREAVWKGSSSVAWEYRLLGMNWGFELGELDVEPGQMEFWQGEKDTNVSMATLRKVASMIPEARLCVLNGDGHLSLMKQENIIANLKDMLSI